jgi:hypothetical protein
MADGARTDRVAVAWELHHVEHLAPWCAMLRMPLLVADHGALPAVAATYPGVAVERLRGVAFPAEPATLARALASRAPRAVFYSDLFSRKALRAMLGGARDAPRVVYVPHGFSEKRQDWARGTAFQDVAVLYGQHAFDQLAALGVAGYLHHFIVAGNLRAAYHRAHAAHFRALLAPLGLDGAAPARTLLYAPTWRDAIGSSSFFKAFAAFVTGLPSGWRLIVKLHPHLERDAATIDALASLCRGRDAHLVRASPLCYPFLDLADAYVGDMSSLAYDFLATGRPMFFANAAAGSPADAAGSRLFACGTVIAPERFGDLYRIVDEAWAHDAERFGPARAALEAYTHAPERAPADLVDEVDAVLAGVAPTWMYAKLAPPPGAAG